MKSSDLSNASESFKRRNPEFFDRILGSLGRACAERNPVQALDGVRKEQRKRQGRVSVCITIVSVRRRELDSDNLQFALKPVRDAIANAIGCDDADARIRWQYGQQITVGQSGTLLIVEKIS